jgi:hypothetical protein
MPVGWQSIGGSKGRPTGLELRACIKDPKTNILFYQPCTPVNDDKWKMIKTNDWYYMKGNVNSTTGSAVTGGALAARRRRT